MLFTNWNQNLRINSQVIKNAMKPMYKREVISYYSVPSTVQAQCLVFTNGNTFSIFES